MLKRMPTLNLLFLGIMFLTLIGLSRTYLLMLILLMSTYFFTFVGDSL
jgi:hypothetical protein